MTNTQLAAASDIKKGTTQVNAMYIGSQLMWYKGTLPPGYTEVEYIASTASGGQYIDLNILLYDTLNKQYDIAIKFRPIGPGMDNGTQYTMFGCQDNTGSPWPGTFIRKNTSNATMTGRYIGGTGKDNTIGNVGSDIELTEKTPPSKNVTNLNNSNKTHTWGTSLFCIFDSQDKSVKARYIEARLYYFKLFVEGVLVRDMIPCKNPSDVPGMYDTVNKVFYPSLSNTAFNAGPNVGLPYDAEVEYLQSDGYQYIDTGVFINSSNFEIGYTAEGFGAFGWVHQMDGNGTWITLENQSGNGTCRWWYGSFGMSQVAGYQSGFYTIKYNFGSGITINGSTSSFSGSFGNDNISGVSLKFFSRYDFRAQSVEQDQVLACKFSSFYVKVDGVLVGDFIPVRVGQTGYMYDKVSGQLFGNNGTGSFTLGPDKS